jgi:D-alanyl-D-alanine carboxypeptidase/D-alanyl-D-alanine-endopeptidase (penicillin-binding protein 4)
MTSSSSAAATPASATNAVFDRLAAALKAVGVTRIDRIAIDDSRFERLVRHPDWPDDQQDEWYQAPVGALNFNDNCVDAAARIADGKPVLTLTPNLPPEMYRNELRTSGKGAPAVVRAPDSDVVRYIGVVQKPLGFEPVAVRDPTLFAGLAFKQALRDRGVTVAGEVVRRTTDADSRRKARRVHVETGTLRDALLRANTYSQNLFAECLLKTIAAYGPDGQPTGHAGSWERGSFIIRKTLSDARLNLGDAVISDGSGLSHSNRVSAAQIVGLLQLMAKGPHAAAFRESLAQPGKPGTMQRGYAFPSLTGKMRAKTGTIAGVRTLAGYVRRPDGREVAFALLINGNGSAELRTKIARILAETR